MSLAELKVSGVGGSTLKKLEENGYGSISSVAISTIQELSAVPGIGDSVAKKLIVEARKSFDLGLKTARSYKEREEEYFYLNTGSSELNSLFGLKGGIKSGTITELSGINGCGKTQLCHQLAVHALLPKKKGGLGGNTVIWIDTENTFRLSRIKEMLAPYGENLDDYIDRIVVGRAYNSEHQMMMTSEALDSYEDITLFIIDSLMAHFRSEFIGRGTLATRQQLLSKHIAIIAKAVDIKNFACVVTNQVSSKPDQFFGDPNQPVGGNVVGHAMTTRVLLRKGSGPKRTATLTKSPELVDGKKEFGIVRQGIRDLEEAKKLEKLNEKEMEGLTKRYSKENKLTNVSEEDPNEISDNDKLETETSEEIAEEIPSEPTTVKKAKSKRKTKK